MFEIADREQPKDELKGPKRQFDIAKFRLEGI